MAKEKRTNTASQKRAGAAKQRRKKRSGAPFLVLLLLALAAAAAGGFVYYKYLMPTSEQMTLAAYYEPAQENEAVVILNQEYMQASDSAGAPFGLCEDGTYYLRLDFIKSNLDDRYVYDSDGGILRYTTYTQMTTATKDSADITVTTYAGAEQNDAEESLETPAVRVETAEDGTSYAYVSLPFIQRFTDITCYAADADASAEAPGRLVIYTAGFETTAATVSSDTQLRRFGGPKSKILADVSKGTEVTVVENYGSWSKVLTQDGVLGCIRNSKLSKTSDYTVAETMAAAEPTHNLLDRRINLVWHQSMSPTSNEAGTELLAQTQGVNVVCPTWFGIEDNSGAIWTNTSAEYVAYCHGKGMQVWGLANNLERSNVDSATVLNSAKSRDRLITNLVQAAVAADLDGINIDFEALPIEAKNGYIEFVRELSLQCKARGLILSVDNYAPLDNNLFYNRTEEGRYADYLIIMAYDEHYGGQKEAGSGSSLDFVNLAISDTLEEVSADQVVLGLPFYTRVWSGEDGENLTSTTLSMANTQNYLTAHAVDPVWDETEGQYVADFSLDGVRTRIWVEDERSLAGKLELMNSYNLAGCAFWKLGMESSGIWSVIEKYL